MSMNLIWCLNHNIQNSKSKSKEQEQEESVNHLPSPTHFILIAGLLYILYIYKDKVFQHLLQWLVVIRMHLQPDIALGEVE
jgi:hypothetical protein